MGIGIPSLYLDNQLFQENYLSQEPEVIELGSQDIPQQQQPQFKLFLEECCNYLVPENSVITAKMIYESFGCKEYQCIDADGRHNALVFDLNKDLQEFYHWNKVLALVTNNGTSEHCFNQLTCFKNIHDLCVSGGLMIHVLPVGGYENHGLYNYHPTFFYNLAAANHYKVLGIYLSTNKTVDDSLWVLPGLIPYQTNLISSLEQYSGNSDMG